MPDPHAKLWAQIDRNSPGTQPVNVSPATIHWHLGKYIPWFYATALVVGLMILGATSQILVLAKLWLALIWAIWSIIYLWLSQRELQAHARLFGSLSEIEVNRQTGDPWKVGIGILVAVFIWIIGVFAHWSWPIYGYVEWAIIVCSVITAVVEKYLTNSWILRYQAAVAGQQRYERE